PGRDRRRETPSVPWTSPGRCPCAEASQSASSPLGPFVSRAPSKTPGAEAGSTATRLNHPRPDRANAVLSPDVVIVSGVWRRRHHLVFCRRTPVRAKQSNRPSSTAEQDHVARGSLSIVLRNCYPASRPKASAVPRRRWERGPSSTAVSRLSGSAIIGVTMALSGGIDRRFRRQD